jgi:GntR family transcriptional regulator / MocR family aminotransferase
MRWSPCVHQVLLRRVRLHTSGAQSIAEYAMSPPERPALSLGYGVIGAGEIAPALSRLRHALLGGA